MEKNNGNKRFSPGKLLMFSKKNTRTRVFHYFYNDTSLKGTTFNAFGVEGSPELHHTEKFAGYMKRGVPFLLVSEPEIVDNTSSYFSIYRYRRQFNTKRNFWRIKFLYEKNIFVTYLTKKQYSQELVIACPRRINKDYTQKRNANS